MRDALPHVTREPIGPLINRIGKAAMDADSTQEVAAQLLPVLLPAVSAGLEDSMDDVRTAAHIRAGTGLTPPTSAPGLGSPRPHPHWDRAHPAHICAGTAGARRRGRRTLSDLGQVRAARERAGARVRRGACLPCVGYLFRGRHRGLATAALRLAALASERADRAIHACRAATGSHTHTFTHAGTHARTHARTHGAMHARARAPKLAGL